MTHPYKEIRLRGFPVSEGIAIGLLHYLSENEEDPIPEFAIDYEAEEEHIHRFQKALSHSRRDLENLHETLQVRGHSEAAMIIGTHIQMLEDPMITEEVHTRIRQTRKNVETVFGSVIQDIEKQMQTQGNSYFQERITDVKDLSMRVMRHLRKASKQRFEEIPPNSIVMVGHLAPSYVAAFEAGRVLGILSEQGGASSHAALIARSKGIPYITKISKASLQKAQIGFPIILDGLKGEVILNPSEETLESYRALEGSTKKKISRNKKKQKTETKDGVYISLFANISESQEVPLLKTLNLDGIGLYRSEYLFLRNKNFLVSENSQYEHYKTLVEQAGGKPITIRVMDVGGDKDPLFFLNHKNSAVGERGIRFLLAHKKLFLTQLKALLRAGVHGPLKILLPFVTDLQEVLETKNLIELAKNQLSAKGKNFQKHICLGSMIEVPSAVMICDLLAKECDFLSLGTNDLLQFTVGIDRSVSSGFFSLPLGLIRMIHRVVLQTKQSGIRLSICGEIASDPLIVPLLIGLGIKELSCSTRFIPKVRSAIQGIRYEECVCLAEKIAELETTEAVYLALEKFRS